MSHCKYNVVSTGYLTGGNAVIPMGAYVHGAILLSDAAHAATLIVYDNATTNAGTQVITLSIPASTTAPEIVMFNHPIQVNNGIYSISAGTGAKHIVFYSLGA